MAPIKDSKQEANRRPNWVLGLLSGICSSAAIMLVIAAIQGISQLPFMHADHPWAVNWPVDALCGGLFTAIMVVAFYNDNRLRRHR